MGLQRLREREFSGLGAQLGAQHFVLSVRDSRLRLAAYFDKTLDAIDAMPEALP